MSQAKKDQGSEFYPGVDDWKPHTLKPGTILIQLDYRSEYAIRETRIPASSYFANGDTKVKNMNNFPSAKDLGEKVQVRPFRAPFSSEFLYQSKISFYQVQKHVNCEISEVKNNPIYGIGGSTQYFIEKKENLIKNGYLKLEAILQTTERNHDIPIFKRAEQKSITDKELRVLIPKAHEQMLLFMESSGNALEISRANKIRSLMRESNDLKEGKSFNVIKTPYSEAHTEEKPKGLKR